MKNKNNVFTLVALALAIPGAAHAFSQEKDGIKISVKDFMKNPYAQVIDNPSWKITAEDLQKHNIAAIKVNVTNNTDKPICISARSIKLLQATSEEIATKFKKSEILPPFLLSCLNGIIGTGFWFRMICQEATNLAGHANHFGIDPNNFPEKTGDKLADDLKIAAEILNQTTEQINNGQNIDDIVTSFCSTFLNRTFKIAGIATLTGIGGAFAYWSYLKDLNNQLVILLQQSLLDEMTTIAPNQSVEKIIFCDGMLSQNFNFNVFNKSQVPVAEFAVDLSA